MQTRLGPEVVPLRRHKAPLDIFEIYTCQRSVMLSFICGSSTSGLIHNINGIALPQKELCPTFAAVRCSRKVGSRLTAAVDHHDGPGMTLLTWDLKLYIQLAAHRCTVVRIFSADEEVALTRNGEHFGRGCNCNQKHHGESLHGATLYMTLQGASIFVNHKDTETQRKTKFVLLCVSVSLWFLTFVACNLCSSNTIKRFAMRVSSFLTTLAVLFAVASVAEAQSTSTVCNLPHASGVQQRQLM